MRPFWAEAHILYGQCLMQMNEFERGMKHLKLAHHLNEAIPWSNTSLDTAKLTDLFQTLKSKIDTLAVKQEL